MRTKKALALQILVTLLVVVFLVVLYFLIRPSPNNPVNAVIFAIGSIAVHWYGLLIALSFIPCIYTAVWIAKNWGINPDHIYNLAILAAPLAVIFARLFYCALNWGYFSLHPVEILYIWMGGLSLYGVIFGGVLACLIYAAVSKIPVLRILDLGAPALILGQAIGRWGNFFNQELFGYPTDLPWKMWVNPDAVQALQNQVHSFPPETRQWILGSQYFHPTFLYESIANVLLFSLLIWVARRKDLRRGVIISLYLIIYSVYRFLEEFVRIEPASVGPLSWGQIGALATILVGVLILLYSNRLKPQVVAAPVGATGAGKLAMPAGSAQSPVVLPAVVSLRWQLPLSSRRFLLSSLSPLLPLSLRPLLRRLRSLRPTTRNSSPLPRAALRSPR
ncbi:MAG: prolipoprotein diacylglyceryl transferase [Coprothermobacterota bacterium]|nr:prolipoprotein diacylglyceryl transferase [Coprothermobacterota bacterium]